MPCNDLQLEDLTQSTRERQKKVYKERDTKRLQETKHLKASKSSDEEENYCACGLIITTTKTFHTRLPQNRFISLNVALNQRGLGGDTSANYHKQ